MSPMEDFAREYPDDENIALPTVDAPGRERAGESKEFSERCEAKKGSGQRGNNELVDLIKGLVDRLYRLESSQTELRTEVAEGARSRRVSEDHPMTTNISPNTFESALERWKERQTGGKTQMLCHTGTSLSTSMITRNRIDMCSHAMVWSWSGPTRGKNGREPGCKKSFRLPRCKTERAEDPPF